MTDFSQVAVTSTNAEIWTQYEQFPEMAVKKNRSRLSPGFVFQVTGLDPTIKYKMSVKLCAKDNFKYKYGPVDEDGVKKDKWYPTSDFGKEQDAQYVGHHWGPRTGEVWMRTGVEFLQLFLCTVPDEYSFFVEQKRVYIASFVIIDTETNVEFEIQFDFQKFVTVSSYRKQYEKPTEKLPRAHASPPVVEPLETEPSQVQKRRSTKRRYNVESFTAVNGSEMKRQKVYVTPPVRHRQYVDLTSETEDSHVMPQPEEYEDLNGHFVGDQHVKNQEFQGSVAGDQARDAYIDDDEFDSMEPVDEWQSNQAAPETDSFHHVTQQHYQRFQGQREFSPDVEQPHGFPAHPVVYQNEFDNGNHMDHYEDDSTEPVDESQFDEAAPETDRFQHETQQHHQRFQGQCEFSPDVEQPHGLPADSVVYQDDFDNGNHMDHYEDDSTVPVDESQYDQAAPEMNGVYHVNQQQHQEFEEPYVNLVDDEQYPDDSEDYNDVCEDDATAHVQETAPSPHYVAVEAIEREVYEDDVYERYPMSPILANTQQIEDVYHAAPDSFQMVPNLDNIGRIEEVYDAAPEDFQMAPAVGNIDDVEYGQKGNDSYDINSPGHPVLRDHATSSTQAGEAPEFDGNLEFAADDEYEVGQEEIEELFGMEFQKTGDKFD